jgi:hypothetical protein
VTGQGVKGFAGLVAGVQELDRARGRAQDSRTDSMPMQFYPRLRGKHAIPMSFAESVPSLGASQKRPREASPVRCNFLLAYFFIG